MGFKGIRTRDPRSGVTLVEIMISIAVVLISIVGLLFVIAHATKQNQANRETLAAHRAAMAVIERMSSKPLADVFRMFNGIDDTNPASPMGYATGETGLETYLDLAEPGDWFDVELTAGPGGTRVPALRPPAGRTRCGQVLFPTSAAGDELWENPSDPNNDWQRWFQMPRDLDGTGAVEASTDKSAGYRILPVIVTVQWEGITGVRTLTYKHILFGR